MSDAKRVIIVALILLLIMNLCHMRRYEQQKKVLDERVQAYKDAYDNLADAHDSLMQNYAVMEVEQHKVETKYQELLQINKSEYEKLIAGYDTLSIDEHVAKLSEFLSEEDHI